MSAVPAQDPQEDKTDTDSEEEIVEPIAPSGEDPTMVLSRENVRKAKEDKSGRVYRVYADGIFDLFHLGHMRALEQAKKALGAPEKTFLLCGVCDDEMTHKYKGKTVMNHKLRCDSVEHCKWVDQVVPDAPWVIDEAFMEKYKIDFVAHDALPYKDISGASADGDVYRPIKKMGKFLETQRTDGISTSDLIVMIVRDYDAYIQRNLARGYTKEQMNVGKSWEVRYKAKEKRKKVDEAVKSTRTELGTINREVRAFLYEFNPKYLMHRENNRYMFTPKDYASHVRKSIPHAEGLIYHTAGLAKAVLSTTYHVLSYVVPCCYCNCRNKAKAT